jgi:TolB-like protein
MLAPNTPSKEILFSAEAIDQELEKIFRDPLFMVSDILKRFLSFIVHETLDGRSNQLKEYTIGLCVLNKAADFQPRYNAIVRIHAGRLRRALHHYYNEAGKYDPICIVMQTGSYIPVFTEQGSVENAKIVEGRQNKEHTTTEIPSPEMIVGVMPFTYFEKIESRISFAEALAARLNTELAHQKNISVIAWYTMKRFAEKRIDMNEVANATGIRYLISGDIQYVEDQFRINLEMDDVTTSRQVFSEVFEQRLTASNIFSVQDEIVKQVVSLFEKHLACSEQKQNEGPLTVVA